MAKIIYAVHRKGGKEYIWRIPENVQVREQDWAVVRTQFGIGVARVLRLGEMDDAEAEKLESVVQAVSDRSMLPTPEPRPKKKGKNRARKRRRRAARAAAVVEKEKKRWTESQLDISPYWDKGYSIPQLDEIRKGLLIGVDVAQYADPSILPSKMRKKRWALIRPLAKFMGYLPDGLSREQAKEILLGIESRVDVTQYADPALSSKIMRLCRQCLEAGVDAAQLKGKTRKELSACLRAHMEAAASASATAAEIKPEPGSGSRELPKINRNRVPVLLLCRNRVYISSFFLSLRRSALAICFSHVFSVSQRRKSRSGSSSCTLSPASSAS